jgi:hypothetical protein
VMTIHQPHDLETIRDALRCDNPRFRCHGTREPVLVHCPAHEDSDPSLKLDVEGGTLLWRCFAHCTQSAVRAALIARGLYDPNGTSRMNGGPTMTNNNAPQGKRKRDWNDVVCWYTYHDEHGNVAHQTGRYEHPKEFTQRRPNPAQPGHWLGNLQGIRLYPYHLLELIAADEATRVLYPEGEKDVETARAAG